MGSATGAASGALCGGVASLLVLALVFQTWGNHGAQTGIATWLAVGILFSGGLGGAVVWERWSKGSLAAGAFIVFVLGGLLGGLIGGVGLLASLPIYYVAAGGSYTTQLSSVSVVLMTVTTVTVEGAVAGAVIGRSQRRAASLVSVVFATETGLIFLRFGLFYASFSGLDVVFELVIFLFGGFVGVAIWEAIFSKDARAGPSPFSGGSDSRDDPRT